MAKEPEIPHYEATVKTFIAPFLLKEGTRFHYEGAYSPTFIPLNDAAEAAREAYLEERPNGGLHPTASLRTNGGEPGENEPAPAPTATDITEPVAVKEEVNPTLAAPGKAKPGPTEGGKVLDIK